MSVVLGISCYYHDSAAALVVDGELVAALQEERLSRIKNDASFPMRAIEQVLAMGAMEARDLDLVVFYEHPYRKLERVLTSHFAFFPHGLRHFGKAVGSQLASKLWIVDHIASRLHIERRRVQFCTHHQSHAASAFFCSPFAKAATLCVDGVGESETTTLWRGEGHQLEQIESLHFPDSLGLFYAAITAFLGFRVNQDEYKVMGLAAYGQPIFEDECMRMCAPLASGGFVLNMDFFAGFLNAKQGYTKAMPTLLGAPRPYGKPWDLRTTEDQRYACIAASAQKVLVACVLGLGRRALEGSATRNLCLAGGVALNAVANGALWQTGYFDDIFVQPAAGDAGGALGAAFWGARECGDARPGPMRHAGWGVALNPDRALSIARALGLALRRVEDPADQVAQATLQGEVVAYASGRSEWGPRALGGRSYLADASDIAMRHRLNRRIKKREDFRPFSPAVLASHWERYLACAPSAMNPFMTSTSFVRGACEKTRSAANSDQGLDGAAGVDVPHDVAVPHDIGNGRALAAAIHKDGSARAQYVTDATQGELGRILSSREKMGAAPALLNTSLNGPGDPIAATESDVIECFITHGGDKLFIEDLLIEAPPS